MNKKATTKNTKIRALPFAIGCPKCEAGFRVVSANEQRIIVQHLEQDASHRACENRGKMYSFPTPMIEVQEV